MLGGESEQDGVLVDCLFPLDDPAPEGAGPVVQAPCNPDAQAVGGALAFPAHYGLDVIDILHDSDQLF